jgi:mannosyl-oligosaccharide alpha-1,3-glucosidase
VLKLSKCISLKERYFPYNCTDETYYDYFDHQKYKGWGYHEITVSLDKIPVLVRGGSIIPRKDRVRGSTARMARDPYTLFITLSDAVHPRV